MSRPDVLFHGSPVLVTQLEPINRAIYAAEDRLIAIAFALVLRPDQRGNTGCRLIMGGPEPRIKIERGEIDADGLGYLDRLSPDDFEPGEHWQWPASKPVKPLGYDVVRTADYLHWIVT